VTTEFPGSIPGRRTLSAIVRTGKFRPGAEGFDIQGSLRTQCTLHLGLVVRETAFNSNPFTKGHKPGGAFVDALKFCLVVLGP
jgi:hypothetical protein